MILNGPVTSTINFFYNNFFFICSTFPQKHFKLKEKSPRCAACNHSFNPFIMIYMSYLERDLLQLFASRNCAPLVSVFSLPPLYLTLSTKRKEKKNKLLIQDDKEWQKNIIIRCDSCFLHIYIFIVTYLNEEINDTTFSLMEKFSSCFNSFKIRQKLVLFFVDSSNLSRYQWR